MIRYALILIILIIGGVSIFLLPGKNNTENATNKVKAVVYKSPNCGCCSNHAAYLKKQGFDVETKLVDDIGSIKESHNIPHDMQSCHTTVIGDYFVEGHMPIEAISKLLEEKPEVDGITLPGMPAGSPGMPGAKQEIFEIYSLNNGESDSFMEL